MRTFRPTEVEDLATITCDGCGRTWDRDSSEAGPEFMHLRADWGFGSKKDLEVWTADICEDCVDKDLVPIINFVRATRKPFSSPTDLDIFHIWADSQQG